MILDDDPRLRTLVLVRNRLFRAFAPDATPDGFPDRIVAATMIPSVRAVAAVERGATDLAPLLRNLPPAFVWRYVKGADVTDPRRLDANLP